MAGKVTEAKALFALKGIAGKVSRKLRPLLKPGKSQFDLRLVGTVSGSEVDLHHAGTLAVEVDTTQQTAPTGAELLAAVKRFHDDEAWDRVVKGLAKFPWNDLEKAELKTVREEVLSRAARTYPKRGDVKVYLDE